MVIVNTVATLSSNTPPIICGKIKDQLPADY
jgi:hypothetical protein